MSKQRAEGAEEETMEDGRGNELKTGDVVMLDGIGGPRMLVNGWGPEGQAVCIWFEGDELHSADIYPECLAALEPDQ